MVTSVINEIPPELLSHIFELGRAAPHSSSTYRVVRDHGTLVDPEEPDRLITTDVRVFFARVPVFPFRVSKVCRHWRTVAISTPSLWTAITVGPANISFDLVATLLQRSKALPIDIIVWSDALGLGPYFMLHSNIDFTCLLSMLIPHVHRWRSLRLVVRDFSFVYAFLRKVSDPSISLVPKLEALELEYNNPMLERNNVDNANLSKPLTLFGGTAPLLTRLRLIGVHINWSQSWISSPSNLKVLHFTFQSDNPTWAQFSTTLRSAPALEKLNLSWSKSHNDPVSGDWFQVVEHTPGRSPADVEDPIRLPRVTELALRLLPKTRATGLLRRLYLPALNNLTLHFQGRISTSFIHQLVGPATSPSGRDPSGTGSLLSQLETFQIHSAWRGDDCIELLYGQSQNVATLVILMARYGPGALLDILGTPRAQGDVWLPRLRTLSVVHAPGKAVRAVVEKRKELGVPLQALYLNQRCGISVDDLAWLRENVDTVEIFTGSRSM